MSQGERILLVDDHPLVCSMLTALLKANFDIDVCASCGSMQEALALLPATQPTMVVIDISLTDGNGLSLIRKLKQFDSPIRILVMSGHEAAVFGQRAFDEGAHGYINKQASPEEILKAISHVIQGDYYFAEASLAKLCETSQQRPSRQPSSKQSLTRRELEVIALIASGQAHAQIAQSLNISRKTLDTHKGNMKKKLNLKTTHDLTRYAQQWQVSQS